MNALIIGGGVIGLSIARELRLRGADGITVVESGKIGREASWAAAGMLSPNVEMSPDAAFHEACRLSNELFSGIAACLLDETGIDIELDRTGTILAAMNAEDLGHIDSRFAEQNAAGLPVHRLSAREVRSLEPNLSEAALGGLFYHEDGQVENRKMISALAAFARQNKVTLIEGSPVDELLTEKNRVTGCRAGEKLYFADVTIVTTGAWTSLIKIGDADFPVAVLPIKGQMLCFEPEGRLLDHIVCSPRGYVVPRKCETILVGATVEDVGFQKDVTPDGINALRSAAEELVPFLRNEKVATSWAGLRPFVADGLPVIGNVCGAEGLFVATGHYRNGILLAPLTAKLIAEMVLDGKVDHASEIFSPDRLKDRGRAAIQA